MIKDVKTAAATESLAGALKIMRDAKIGCLVVTGTDGTPVGIFTERDLLIKMAEVGHAIVSMTMAELMSKPLTIISPDATIWDAVTLMGRAGIRRLPVVENGRLVGILTERDVLRLVLSQQSLILESVSESMPTATREQLRELTEHFGVGIPPGKASQRPS